MESFTIGLAARSCIGIGFLPFTVIKARYEVNTSLVHILLYFIMVNIVIQSGIFEYRGVMQAVSTIWRTEGGRGECCNKTLHGHVHITNIN